MSPEKIASVPMKLIRLQPDSKLPPPGVSWKNGVSADPLIHAKWLDDGNNLGMPPEENNRVVLDFDGVDHQGGREVATDFYRKYVDLGTFIVETANDNIHFHFSGKTQTRKVIQNGEIVGDIKGNGYVVWIGSQIQGKFYRLLRDGPLQPFPEHLFPIAEKENRKTEPIREDDPIRRLIRAREWMKKREGKEDGNGRGLQMIKTCRALFKMFGLTEEQVWPLILEFNERCIPPYTEKQLRHKIADSQKGESYV